MNSIICISTFMYAYSALLAFENSQLCICFINVLIFISSLLHWYTNRELSIFHKCDIIVSRSAAVIYCIIGFNIFDIYFWFFATQAVTLSYLMSVYAYKLYVNTNTWIIYHVNFHFITNVCIVYGICLLDNKQISQYETCQNRWILY